MNLSDAFSRTTVLLGPELMHELAGAHIAVIGLGAVGAASAEFLARLGVGRFTLVDFDRATPSNLNRNLGVLVDTLGRNKAEIMKERIERINPQAQVDALDVFVHEEHFPLVLEQNYDVLVDAIDSLLPKVLLLRQALGHDYFLISSMGAGGRLDPSQVQAGDLSETRHCPLARHVRKRLRRLGVNGGIRVVFSPEPALPAVMPENSELIDRGRPRHINGTVSYMPAVFAAHITREIISYFQGREKIPDHRSPLQ